MSINVLLPHIASRIAAGEVIERPASVVKELVENALDAGATSIGIECRDGGVRLIRISDNGGGIPAAEVELAFARHATSKIAELADLERVSTLGFRGEALPSIAAVADVEIVSATADDEPAVYLRLENGEIVRKELRSRPRGTTVIVRHLFRHLPARLKFLKSAATENSHIANLVTQYSLAFPEVGFSLSMEGKTTLHTPGNGLTRDALAENYGLETARQMLEVDAGEPPVRVSGLVSPPALNRAGRNYLSFFVNRRWVRSSLLIRAVEDAYHGSLTVGKHPIAILNISLPPEELDINVHPAKTEVKFRNSQTVYRTVTGAVRALLNESRPPEVRAPSPSAAYIPSLWSDAEVEREAPGLTPPPKEPETQAEEPCRSSLPYLRVVGQLGNSYIMAEGPDGLYLIDQHAAHERILFEKVLMQRARRQVEMQGLLDPLVIELNPRQQEVVKERGELLSQFGLDLEPFGERSYLLRAVPALMREADLAGSVLGLLDALPNPEAPLSREEKVAQSIACHGAIKAGDTLTHEEMRELVRQLEQAGQPRTCPHGRPTIVHLSSRQLEKEFRRTG